VLSLAVLLPSLAGGCIRARARTVAEVPPLDMPAPPPRVVEANDQAPPQPIPLPGEPTRTEVPRPSPPRAEAPKPAEAKPEAPPVEAQKPPEEPKPTLQTAPTPREVEVERRVRALIAEATNNLNHINYQALNTDARTQYDMAKAFIRQAEDALRAKNLNFASNLADKAAALAAQLAGK
jgi:outer membrane biosynthesis protein TonB